MKPPRMATEARAEDRDVYSARLRAYEPQIGFPCLSYALLSLIPILTDKVPTAATDRYWRCYINPKFFASLSADEGAMVLVHEVWHLLLDHFVRSENKGVPIEDHMLFNICEDIEINQHDELHKRLPNYTDGQIEAEPCTPALFHVPPNLLAEEYYDILKKRWPSISKSVVIGPGSGNCGSCTGTGDDKDYELPPPNGKTIPGVSEVRAKIIGQETARQIVQEAARSRGTVPANWVRWAERTLKPQVDWRAQVRPSLQGMVISKSGNFWPDHRRPSRRQHLYGDILRPFYQDVIQHVGFIIDTSGSMNDRMVGQGIAEVDGILTAMYGRLEVCVYFTDAAAACVQKVTCASQMIPYGGGGTDMGAGFEAIARDVRDGNITKPSIIVVLTDGYTPWPNNPPDDTRVLVLLVAEGTSPDWAVPPEHEVIKISMENQEEADHHMVAVVSHG